MNTNDETPGASAGELTEDRSYTIIVEVNADNIEQAFDAISDAAFSLSESAQVVGGYDCLERIEAAAKAEAIEAFVAWIARDAAYNGASDPGQEFYDRGLNPWLVEEASRFWLQASQPKRSIRELRDQEDQS